MSKRRTSTHQQMRSCTTVQVSLQDLLQADKPTTQATVTRVSDDGRRLYTKDVEITPHIPEKRRRSNSDAPSSCPPTTINSHLDVDFTLDDAVYQQPPPTKQPAKRYSSSDDPLKEWLSVREEYLKEFARLEGPGDALFSECDACGIQVSAPYRCIDCFSRRLLCRACCVGTHSDHPLHRIEQWNLRFFERTSLQTAGLRIQLGHPPASPCPVQVTVNDFVVLHTNGIHNVTLSFCACDDRSKHGSSMQQLLRRRWFPATFEQPHTCATFSLLEHFQLQTLQGKTPSYDYYSALRLLSDNSGLKTIPVRYKEFLRMNREYVHVLNLKRGGRAHEEGGVSGTKPGELVVICPACPDEDVNLTVDWKNVPDDKKFLYTLYLALDACFRLKRRLVSSLEKDPGLGADWGYFVEGEPFRRFILSVTDQKEMSTCSGFAALDYANTKFSRGYAATGVCLVVCARHEFIQPNGVADLQVGERYANMDYIFASAMKHKSRSLKVLVSYDIACQWSKTVIERLKNLPPLIRLHLVSSMLRFAVPKLHIYSHTKACQEKFSLNYLPGVGRTDGEGVERPWANIGATSTSIRVMGPGARIETLNNHWSHWNWQKVTNLGLLLSRRLRAAISERDLQQSAFEIFSSKQGSQTEKWRQMVDAFEQDPSQPNPYHVADRKKKNKSTPSNRSNQEAEASTTDSPPPTNTPAGFIALGFGILDQQHHIQSLLKNEPSRTSGKLRSHETNITQLRTQLKQSLEQFSALQSIYMPHVACVTLNVEEDFEAAPVLLPSSLSCADRVACHDDLIENEQTHHEIRCQSSLDKLRNLLVIKSRLLSYKNRHTRNQGPNTRARAIINRNQEKIQAQASIFQSSWSALKSLANGDESKIPWPELTPGAIRCLSDPDVQDQHQVRVARRGEHGQANVITLSRDTGDDADGNSNQDIVAVVAKEGYRTVSWIWEDARGADVEDVLRCEWAKSWARSRRWQEEVELLKEEMRRTLVSLRYQASKWDERAQRSYDNEYACGLKAYALRQSDLRVSLASKFAEMWKKGFDDTVKGVLEIDDDEGQGTTDPVGSDIGLFR